MRKIYNLRQSLTATLSVAILAFGVLSYQYEGTVTGAPPGIAASAAAAAQKDVAGARAAFLDVYKVLMHARCMNCHPTGDAPLQGDRSLPHAQNVQRGPDGKGLYALKCADCHQDTNLPGENMPPGNP